MVQFDKALYVATNVELEFRLYKKGDKVFFEAVILFYEQNSAEYFKGIFMEQFRQVTEN